MEARGRSRRRHRRGRALSLSDGVRNGPNDLKIEKETTRFMLGWRRRASTLSNKLYTTGRRDTHFVHKIGDDYFGRARVGDREEFRSHDAAHIWSTAES